MTPNHQHFTSEDLRLPPGKMAPLLGAASGADGMETCCWFCLRVPCEDLCAAGSISELRGFPGSGWGSDPDNWAPEGVVPSELVSIQGYHMFPHSLSTYLGSTQHVPR